MAERDRRIDLRVSEADLEAAAWMWTAVTVAALARASLDASPLELAMAAGARDDLLRAAARAGFACRLAHGTPGDHLVTLRPGVRVLLRSEATAAATADAHGLPAGRLVRRLPRAEAPRAKRPARKTPEGARVVPESSARAPRRVVRPRGQVRKVGKK